MDNANTALLLTEIHPILEKYGISNYFVFLDDDSSSKIICPSTINGQAQMVMETILEAVNKTFSDRKKF